MSAIGHVNTTHIRIHGSIIFSRVFLLKNTFPIHFITKAFRDRVYWSHKFIMFLLEQDWSLFYWSQILRNLDLPLSYPPQPPLSFPLSHLPFPSLSFFFFIIICLFPKNHPLQDKKCLKEENSVKKIAVQKIIYQ